MAKIQTKIVILKFNRIVKDNDNSTFVINSDVAKTLEEVAQEMCGSDIVVETEIKDE